MFNPEIDPTVFENEDKATNARSADKPLIKEGQVPHRFEPKYDPKDAYTMQAELERRQQEEREVESIKSPFLRGLAKAINRIDFGLKPLSMEGLLHPEKLLEIKQLQESLDRQEGYAHAEAAELNKRYDELRTQAKEGIAKIKVLDENQDASTLAEQAMDGVNAIIELKNFEDKFLGMRPPSPEVDQDNPANHPIP